MQAEKIFSLVACTIYDSEIFYNIEEVKSTLGSDVIFVK
jgi:hypothetical protein